MTDQATFDYRYWAFISYSSKDTAHAKWLHRAIETYGIPAKLVEHGHTTPLGEPAPKQFRPVFRDRDELPASADLGEAIQDALAASRCLIVICSPNAALSPWVNREIETFIEMGRSDRIFAYIVDGEPNSGDETECFPPVLRRPIEPLAADARQSKDGRNDAKLKLLAGMLGVGFDALKQRDTQRRVRRLQVVVAAVLLLALVLSGLAWYANAARLRAEAAEANAVNESYVRATAEAQAVSESHVRATAEANAVTEAHARATAQAVAEDERNRAEEEARIARVRELAAKSQAASESQPQHSLLLGIEAVQLGEDATQALTGAKNDLYQALAKTGGLGLGGHRNQSASIAFSANGQLLATGSVDGTVRVWDMSNEVLTQPTHVLRTATSVTSLAFSPDGRWLAAGTGDLGINPDRAYGSGNVDWIWQMRERYLTGEYERLPSSSVYVWDLTASDPSSPVLIGGFEQLVSAVVFSPDGRMLVCGSHDHTVRVWNLDRISDSEPMLRRDHERAILAAAITPNGNWLVIGGDVGKVWLWDLTAPNLADSARVLSGHTSNVHRLAISLDSHWLVTGGWDQTARLWDLTASDPASTSVLVAKHQAPLMSVAISPDNRWIATGGYDNDPTVHLWNLDSRQPITDSLVLRGHERGIMGIAFSPNSQWLMSASLDRTIRAWDLAATDPAASPRVIRGQDSGILGSAASPDGRWLVAGSYDGGVRRWAIGDIIGLSAARNGATIPLTLRGHTDGVPDLAISPNGRWLASGSQDNTARLWDLTSLTPVSFFTSVADAVPSIILEGHEKEVYKLAFSPDGRWLATASSDGTARLWDLSADDPAKTAVSLVGHTADLNAVAFSPDSRWLVTASADRTARLWDVNAVDPAHSFVVLEGHKDRVLVAEFSKDGRWLMTAGTDGTARLWDMTSAPAANSIVLAGHADQVVAAAFSPDSRWLATGSADMTARLWDLSSTITVTAASVLRGHTNYIVALAFSPDSRWLATASMGTSETLRLWDMTAEDPAASAIILHGHTSAVWSVSFTSDGLWLISSSLDGTARAWDLSTIATNPDSIVFSSVAPLFDHVISPNDRWLITADERGAVFIWPLRIEDLVELACLTAGRNSSLNEWEQDFGGIIYHLTCPQLPLHAAFVQNARMIAQAGDVDRARSYLEIALGLDPTLTINPQTEVRKYRALGLIEEASRVAKGEGDVKGAADRLRQALDLDPSLDFDAEREAGRLAASTIAQQGINLIRSGDIANGLAAVRRSAELDPDRDLTSDSYSVCYWGGRWGYGAEVIDACNRYVAAYPESEFARDNRGIVRAQLGDYAGAIEDFRFYVEWSKEHNKNEKEVPQREAWIAELEEGRNPFDAATLEALRGN